MKIITLLLLSFFLFSSWPISGLEPEDVIGVWECEKFPRGLEAEIGLKDIPLKCVIKVGEDGSFVVSGLPVRSPYRIVDFRGGWKIVSGKITPSGKDSLDLNGHFLTGYRKRGVLGLSYVVSGMDEYKLFFKKKEIPPKPE